MPQAAFATHRVQQVRELRAAGVPLEDICETLGMSPTTLRRLIREHNIPSLGNSARGTKRGHRTYLRGS
jgi:hypothetical protein